MIPTQVWSVKVTLEAIGTAFSPLTLNLLTLTTPVSYDIIVWCCQLLKISTTAKYFFLFENTFIPLRAQSVMTSQFETPTCGACAASFANNDAVTPYEYLGKGGPAVSAMQNYISYPWVRIPNSYYIQVIILEISRCVGSTTW